MAVSSTNTYTGKGIAESFEDVIFDISPEDTPLLSMAKRMTAGQTYHQWQTDALAAAATNTQVEGNDSSFATLAATTVLGNYTQISSKTVQISGTYDVVKKYGRKSEVAYQLMKGGKELKRDMEYAIVRNQASSAGGAATARSTAGIESWITNRVLGTGSTAGTTPGFSNGTVAAPTDGTQVTFVEADLKSALQLAWTDGLQLTKHVSLALLVSLLSSTTYKVQHKLLLLVLLTCTYLTLVTTQLNLTASCVTKLYCA
jgi:hypothetical protein